MNYDKMFNIFRDVFYKSWFKDEPFTFTSKNVAEENEEMINWVKTLDKANIPEDFIIVSRLFTGMHTALASMNAESNWHKVTLDFHYCSYEGISDEDQFKVKKRP